MKKLFALLLLIVPLVIHAQTITPVPTVHTKGWFIAEGDSTFNRIDSFLVSLKLKNVLTKDGTWFYRDLDKEEAVNIYLDTLNKGYHIYYKGQFLNFDRKIVAVFSKVQYYQINPEITDNPYSQSTYLKKAGRNLTAAGVVGMVTPVVAAVPLSFGGQSARALSIGFSFAGGLTTLITYFSASNNLTKAGKTRFR